MGIFDNGTLRTWDLATMGLIRPLLDRTAPFGNLGSLWPCLPLLEPFGTFWNPFGALLVPFFHFRSLWLHLVLVGPFRPSCSFVAHFDPDLANPKNLLK